MKNPLLQSSWKTIGQKILVKNDYLELWEDEVLRPDGGKSLYYVRRKKPFSIIIPSENDRIHMVRQYRYAVMSDSLEFPMGYVAGESPLKTAQIELKEEMGIDADRLTEIGKFWVACGSSNQIGHVYVANGLSFGKPEPEEGEYFLYEDYNVSEIAQKIVNGEIKDCSTIAAFHFLENNLNKL